MNRVVHFEIQADDTDRAQDFYRSLLGWQFQQFGEHPYWLIVTGPDDEVGINGGLMPRPQPIDGQAITAYVCTVEVESLDEKTASVKELGGEQVVDADEIPGVGTFAYFKDSEGNVFGMLQPAQ